VTRVFALSRDPHRTYGAWLDFGCGCGRVARYLSVLPEVQRLVGIDIDGEHIAWCRRHLAGDFDATPAQPPTRLLSASFDVVYAGSVFTHLDDGRQRAWLREIHRLLTPGGLLIASTHNPSLVWARPDLSQDQHIRLSSDGFLFAPGQNGFNEDSAFHSREYLMASWGSLFGLRRYESFSLNRFQDLHVWCKW
jgi:SAM-dependent methyltransferase